jgi:hypothetical protein
MSSTQLMRSGRYHHLTRAARAGAHGPLPVLTQAHSE